MREMRLGIGSVVLSKAGRDKGRYFVVTALDEGDYVYMIDGELRRLEKPKRKKIKHLELKDVVGDVLRKKLEEGERVFDAEVRSCLKNLGYKPEFSDVDGGTGESETPKEG